MLQGLNINSGTKLMQEVTLRAELMRSKIYRCGRAPQAPSFAGKRRKIPYGEYFWPCAFWKNRSIKAFALLACASTVDHN